MQDDNGTLRRVQVKTSTSTERQNRFSGQFNLPTIRIEAMQSVLDGVLPGAAKREAIDTYLSEIKANTCKHQKLFSRLHCSA